MRRFEETLLAQREMRAAEAALRSKVIIATGTQVFILIVIGAFWAVARNLNLRIALENQATELNAALQRRAMALDAANLQLREVDRLKSGFLAAMSHELRTPLNSIIGFSSILANELPGPLNEEQRKQLGMVRSAARHLLGLINDLLDSSRIESGRMEVEVAEFRIDDVVAEVVRTLEPIAADKRLCLVQDLPAGLPVLRSDRRKCYQVLLNIANNAVKFTESGTVRISAVAIEDRLRVSVSDTGIGIAPEHHALLFEAFRQIEGSVRRVYEGTGLGLHLSRQLTALLGGAIDVSSEVGRGSVFTVSLPIRLQAR